MSDSNLSFTRDPRVVMTLDAGGTNFVFSAIRSGREVVDKVALPAVADDLEGCYAQLIAGFSQVEQQLGERPAAISFAFPGPADYANGVIGDLPNFPAFRGGVALGPFLSRHFGVPVYINNDGNLYAYGEALCGLLPEVNRRLEACGNPKRYHNLIGITLGTGYGCGVVIGGRLLTGDNGCGGDVWLMQNPFDAEMIAEEHVSIRAVRRMYAQYGGGCDTLSPKEIFEVAEGLREGDAAAARRAFHTLGNVVGHTVAHVLDIVDGVVAIGGGLSGAAKYILPGVMEVLHTPLSTCRGERFDRVQMEVFDLSGEEGWRELLRDDSRRVTVPGTGEQVICYPHRKSGIAVSAIGTSEAIALGAYAYALNRLDGIIKQ